jgi:hypothetical protein
VIKRVRKRPVHNTHFGARKGVVYLPKAMIGSMVKVLTERQYKGLHTQIKHLKAKVFKVRKLVYEYSSS